MVGRQWFHLKNIQAGAGDLSRAEGLDQIVQDDATATADVD
jgi:hypothetical protein